MKLWKHGPGIDVDELNALAEAANEVYEAIALSLVTADNITAEQRNAISSALRRTPLIEQVSDDMFSIKGEADLVEGKDWCFATSNKGSFGVFSLEDVMRPWLRDAVFHLWLYDGDEIAGRADYGTLSEYQEAAQEAMLSAGVAA